MRFEPVTDSAQVFQREYFLQFSHFFTVTSVTFASVTLTLKWLM